MHPVEGLWACLRGEVNPLVSGRLRAVDRRVPEPQFFPCASGLLPYDTWAQVTPCSTHDRTSLPDMPERPVVVILNFPASSDEFDVIDRDDGSLSHYPKTWTGLSNLLDGIVSPNEVFVTNAYPVLLKAGGREGSLGAAPNLEQACRRFLAATIDLLQPRAILACGNPARRMLGSIVPSLDQWRRLSFETIDARGQAVVHVDATGAPFTAVALSHPAARPKTRSARRYAVNSRTRSGLCAERAMVSAAVRPERTC